MQAQQLEPRQRVCMPSQTQASCRAPLQPVMRLGPQPRPRMARGPPQAPAHLTTSRVRRIHVPVEGCQNFLAASAEFCTVLYRAHVLS